MSHDVIAEFVQHMSWHPLVNADDVAIEHSAFLDDVADVTEASTMDSLSVLAFMEPVDTDAMPQSYDCGIECRKPVSGADLPWSRKLKGKNQAVKVGLDRA